MNTNMTAAALLALALLAGCSESSAPSASPSASAAASDAPQPAPASSAASAAPEPSLPLFKAASHPPRDDCAGLPGWGEFRAKLEQVVANRDADGLGALTDPAIELDFGGGQGIKEMQRRLGDKDYRLWDQITAMLPLGCAVHDGAATLPWIYARAPDDADPYTGMLVLGAAVPAYEKPDAAGPAFAALNWPIVNVPDYSGPEQAFTKVTLPGGKTAYVESAKLRSLIDYRLIAERKKQGWRITALIAGD